MATGASGSRQRKLLEPHSIGRPAAILRTHLIRAAPEQGR
jgi:hypothetical protein